MIRKLSLALAASLALTGIAEARDGGERGGAPAPALFLAASAATTPAAPEAAPALSGRNLGPRAERSPQTGPADASALSGRNARFAAAGSLDCVATPPDPCGGPVVTLAPCLG